MTGKTRRKHILTLFIGMIILGTFTIIPERVSAKEPFFTLVAKTNDGGVRPDYLNLLKQQLQRININVDAIVFGWSWWWGYYYYRDFDIAYLGFSGGGVDPDFTGVYNENGSLNLFGYHTSMDFDEELGTGINEWYMKEGRQIMPPNSEERIEHYWNWEQYLMDKICPMAPTFAPKTYEAYWANLNGYNSSDGVLQSFGKLSWEDSHKGQANTNELVITDLAWSDLNPIFQDDTSSSFISSATMDPLFWYDRDIQLYPHLAKNLEMINDTYARITIREGIKWQPDPDNLFMFEYLDAEDVFFTLYSWKHISNEQHRFNWIKDMKLVDDYTIDIFIDGDPDDQDNDPFAPFVSLISKKILPEHYLNQTQEPDGKTPDITHSSWNTFATQAFGTGLFQLSEFTAGLETKLEIYPDCWRLDPLITNDPKLDWNNRFGNFTGGIDTLRVKILLNYYERLALFESGRLDMIDISSYPSELEFFELNSNYKISSVLFPNLSFFAYNMREVRPMIGNRTICPNDPTLTVGLALRKAISYAIDRQEMNQLVHNGRYEISNHPIYTTMGVWCNPNIIKYDYNLEKAKEYMAKAGFVIDEPAPMKWYHSFWNFIVEWWPVLVGSVLGLPAIYFSTIGFIKVGKRAKRLSTLKKEFDV
ncbi:MAG: ABC transporter substrate-binding protein [Candidatus Heimdallarchaeota archaeon]